MTASEGRDQCLAVGMDGYLSKPVRPEQLHRTIGQFTQSHGCTLPESVPDEKHYSELSQPWADVIDLELARRQIPGGEEGVRSMAQLMLDQCPILITEIETALTRRDEKRIQRAAHSLKGSADIFGASPVVAAARRIELAGKHGNVDEASEIMPELRKQVSLLQSALAEAAKLRMS